MSTYYLKTIIYTQTTDEKEFNDYIEHLKNEHKIKIRIEETKEKIYYFGKIPSGEEDLYAIKENKND